MAASQQATSAAVELNAITSDPRPDVASRVHNAANTLNVARKGAMTAHNRLEDYLDHGIVPEDLKRSG